MRTLYLILIVGFTTPLYAQINETYTEFMEGTSFQFTTQYTELKGPKGEVIDQVPRIQIPKTMDLLFFNLTKDKWRVTDESYADITRVFRVNWNIDLSAITNSEDYNNIRKHYVIYFSEDHPSEADAVYYKSGIATNDLKWKLEDDGYYTLFYRQKDLLIITIIQRDGFYNRKYNAYEISIPKYP